MSEEPLGQVESALDPSAFCVDHPCPDLVPIRLGTCPNYGGLLVGVKNQGTATAGGSRTRLVFQYYGVTRTLDTPSLNPGASWTTVTPMPARG